MSKHHEKKALKGIMEGKPDNNPAHHTQFNNFIRHSVVDFIIRTTNKTQPEVSSFLWNFPLATVFLFSFLLLAAEWCQYSLLSRVKSITHQQKKFINIFLSLLISYLFVLLSRLVGQAIQDSIYSSALFVSLGVSPFFSTVIYLFFELLVMTFVLWFFGY